jgi:hypothetical protein
MLIMLEIISDPCQFLQGSEVEQTDVDWIMAKAHSHSRLMQIVSSLRIPA